MKKLKFILLTMIAVLSFTACQEDDDLDFVAAEATDLVFNTTFLDNYVLNASLSDNLAERFTWDDASFGVPTSVSYSLQAATMEDFSDYVEGDALYNLGNTTGNEIPVSVGKMIDLAEEAGLTNTAPDNTGTLYFRLMATLGDSGSLPSFSAIQGLNVELQEETTMQGGTCEVDILYAVGAGLPTAGWDWATPVELMCSADGVWSGNVEFTSDGDANFRFFTVEGDWATGRNYPYYADLGYTIDSNFEQNTDDDLNFKFVGTSGLYFLTVDSNTMEITLGPPQGDGGTCEFDQLYGVGAGLADTGWDWGNPAVFSCVADGVYSGTVNLQNVGGADNNFRFFTVLDDWASGRNYPFYADAGYTIDPNLVNAMDDDSNFAFTGTSGEYTITIDTNNLTISLSAGDASCEFDQLYGVGAGLTDTGWDWGNPAVFTCTSNGVYTGTVALQSTADNNNFRFFTILDDWASGRNYPFFADAGYTIDSNLVDAMDDDNNFAFVGADGTYTITIDTNNLTITLE